MVLILFAALGGTVELLASFEGELHYDYILKRGRGECACELVNERATDGKRALKLRMPPEKAHELGGDSDTVFLFDWRGFEAFAFDAFNPQAFPVRLELKIKSAEGVERKKVVRLYQNLVLRPGPSTQQVRIAGRGDISLQEIMYIKLTNKTGREVTVFLDNFRLIARGRVREPRRLVRLTIIGDPRTTMAVTWQSDAGTKSVVKYSGPGGTRKAMGECRRVFPGRWGVFHRVGLAGLRPGGQYRYSVSSDGKSFGPPSAFLTCPRQLKELVFFAGADTKSGREHIARQLPRVLSEGGRLFIYAGDAPQTGGHRRHWDHWFAAIEPVASRIPFMQSTGNHERSLDPVFKNFRAYNTLPGEGTYYSFDYGPVHFVACETEGKIDSRQVGFVESDMRASRPRFPWLVAYFHSPPFSSGEVHRSDMNVRRKLIPVFDRYHLDAAFSGDDHIYERTKPVNLSRSKSAPVGSYRLGTCYVISAGAGAGLYPIVPGNWWTEKAAKKYHLCRIRATFRTFELEARTDKGEVIDRFTLSR